MQGYDFKNMEDCISIQTNQEEMASIAKKLFEKSIYITEFYIKEQNLEDYYLEILGEWIKNGKYY